MDALAWGLIAMGVSWLPAGYLGSRLAFFLDNNWNASLSGDADRALFGAGILLGWITVILVIYLALAYALIMTLYVIIRILGHLFAPR